MYTTNLIQTTSSEINKISNGTLLALIIIGVVLLLLLSLAAIYLIASLRRRNVVLKKVDYLVEDITYKSESLNVTVETINKISNYILSLDAVSQKGFKSMVKLVSENKNYIYSIVKKLQADVEKRENHDKKSVSSKKSTTNKKATTKKTTATKDIAVVKKPRIQTQKLATKKTVNKKNVTTTKKAVVKKPLPSNKKVNKK